MYTAHAQHSTRTSVSLKTIENYLSRLTLDDANRVEGVKFLKGSAEGMAGGIEFFELAAQVCELGGGIMRSALGVREVIRLAVVDGKVHGSLRAKKEIIGKVRGLVWVIRESIQ